MLQWLQMSDADVRLKVQSLGAQQLCNGVVQLETYASQMLQLDLWLRNALEGWQRSDAYRVLGIARSASLSEVRRAFHKLALQLHPDKGGAKEEFQKMQRAYEEILAERGVRRQCGGEDDEDEEEYDNSPPEEACR